MCVGLTLNLSNSISLIKLRTKNDLTRDTKYYIIIIIIILFRIKCCIIFQYSNSI